MTTQVDFYLLSAPHRDGRLRLTCRLAEIAFRHGHRAYIHADKPATVQALDDMLWTFSQRSFVPHATTGKAKSRKDDYPVLIGTETPDDSMNDVLIPLLSTPPAYYTQFVRVLDPVGFDDAEKSVARERYRWYRNAGVTLDKHDIKP